MLVLNHPPASGVVARGSRRPGPAPATARAGTVWYCAASDWSTRGSDWDLLGERAALIGPRVRCGDDDGIGWLSMRSMERSTV